MSKKPKLPAAPNYTMLAQQQAAEQTRLARPNQVTPYGNTTWSGDTQTTTLNPQDQRALSAQQRLGADRSEFAQGMFSRSKQEFANPVNFDKFQRYGTVGDPNVNRRQAEDAAYGRATSRLDPRWKQETSDLDVNLRNQGLRPGDEAYDRATGNASRAKADEYSAAQQDSVAQGRAESELSFSQQMSAADQQNNLRSQQINEELQKRGWSLNEINAMMSGQDVEMPTMPTAARGTAADLLGAGQSQYSSNMDRYNAKNARRQGLFSGLGRIAKFGIGFATGNPMIAASAFT